MRSSDIAYVALGAFIGVGIVFYQVDTPKADKCETYKVAAKPVTAYVMKSPPPIVTPAVCPPAPKREPLVSKTAENDTQPNLSNADDTQAVRPLRHRHWRHHRTRSYWR